MDSSPDSELLVIGWPVVEGSVVEAVVEVGLVVELVVELVAVVDAVVEVEAVVDPVVDAVVELDVGVSVAELASVSPPPSSSPHPIATNTAAASQTCLKFPIATQGTPTRWGADLPSG